MVAASEWGGSATPGRRGALLGHHRPQLAAPPTPSRVEIVALLDERSLARLRAAAPAAWIVTAARALDGRGGLVALLRDGSIDIVVLDPADPRIARRGCTLAELFKAHHTLRGVLYTALTSRGMKACTGLLRTGRCEFVLAGLDDQPAAIRALLERMAGDAVSDLVLERMGNAMALLPRRVRQSIRALFAAPHRFRGVEELAATAAITRRHLARLIKLAGLCNAHQLVIVARVIRAHRTLQEERATLVTAAARLRMDPRILSRHIRLVARCTPSTTLAGLAPAEVVRCCLATLFPADAAGHPPPP